VGQTIEVTQGAPLSSRLPRFYSATSRLFCHQSVFWRLGYFVTLFVVLSNETSLAG